MCYQVTSLKLIAGHHYQAILTAGFAGRITESDLIGLLIASRLNFAVHRPIHDLTGQMRRGPATGHNTPLNNCFVELTSYRHYNVRRPHRRRTSISLHAVVPPPHCAVVLPSYCNAHIPRRRPAGTGGRPESSGGRAPVRQTLRRRRHTLNPVTSSARHVTLPDRHVT